MCMRRVYLVRNCTPCLDPISALCTFVPLSCVHRYGSVIFVNIPRSVRDNYLGLLKPFIKLPQGRQASLLDAGSLRSDGASSGPPGAASVFLPVDAWTAARFGKPLSCFQPSVGEGSCILAVCMCEKETV